MFIDISALLLAAFFGYGEKLAEQQFAVMNTVFKSNNKRYREIIYRKLFVQNYSLSRFRKKLIVALPPHHGFFIMPLHLTKLN